MPVGVKVAWSMVIAAEPVMAPLWVITRPRRG